MDFDNQTYRDIEWALNNEHAPKIVSSRWNLTGYRSQNHTEEKSAGLRKEELDNPYQNSEYGTEHQLLDHSFSQDTPSDLTPNFAANLIHRLRRNTSDFLVGVV